MYELLLYFPDHNLTEYVLCAQRTIVLEYIDDATTGGPKVLRIMTVADSR